MGKHSNITKKTGSTSASTTFASPAKARVGISPKGHTPLGLFSHEKKDVVKKGKSLGHTPEGKNTISLNAHSTGKNHLLGKSPGATIVEENDFYTATDFRTKYHALVVALKNLKERTDGDFLGKLHDQSHHNAAYLSIEKCLFMLKEMLTIPVVDRDFDFIAKLNEAITSTEADRALYNPLGLRPIYQHLSFRDYDWSAAGNTSAFRAPLTEADINNVTPDVASLTQYNIPVSMTPVTPTPPAEDTDDDAEVDDFASRLGAH